MTATITRETKRESFEGVLKTLGERQSNVLYYLGNLQVTGGVTANELALFMWKRKAIATPERNNVHPRLNELVALRLVGIEGKRKCSVTGKTCAIYKLKVGVVD